MPSEFVWKNLLEEGGGYHQEVHPHLTAPNVCATRCDIAGFYIWKEASKNWKLVGDFSYTDSNDWGASAFAWHPTDPNTFWIYCGTYFYTRASLYKSTDGGDTITKLNGFPDIDGGGNQNRRRSTGSRLVVAPDNPNIILCGSFSSPRNPSTDVGFFRSTDGGMSWTPQNVATLSGQIIPSLNQGNGQTTICFDRVLTGHCYVAIFGVGICKSTDYGVNWSFIGGQKMPYKMVASNGILYVAGIYQDDLPVVSGDTLQGLSKYQNGSWISLMTGGSRPPLNYGLDITLLDVNPFDPTEIICGHYGYGNLWKSNNSGASFSPFYLDNYFPGSRWNDGQVTPYSKGITDVKYSPTTPGTLWLADVFGVNRSVNFNTSNPFYQGFYSGLENTLPLQVCHPPGGKITVAMFDLDGVQFNNKNASPTSKIGGIIPFIAGSPRYNCSPGLDFCEAAPTTMVRAGVIGYDLNTSVHKIAKSIDGGASFNELSASPTKVEKVKVSSNDSNFWVALRDGLNPQYTIDGGSTWSNIPGLTSACTPDSYLSNPGHPLDKDKTNGNIFYVIDDVSTSSTRRNVFKITKSGSSVTATQVNNGLPRATASRNLKLKTSSSGDIWIGLYNEGLWRSTNAGVGFSQIANIQSCYTLCTGIPASGFLAPTIYIAGIIAGVYGIYYSQDSGASWVLMSDNPNNARGLQLFPTCMDSSPTEFGVIYLGTDGHGMFYSGIDAGGGSSSGGVSSSYSGISNGGIVQLIYDPNISSSSRTIQARLIYD